MINNARLFSLYDSEERNDTMNELYHHGVLGQKWGVRRYQNSDGSLTDEGRKRYNRDMAKLKERQSRSKRWEEKANDRAQSYNQASRKLIRYPFEKPIKRTMYKWSNFGHDRALNSANRYTKKVLKRYGKNGLNVLSDKQIKRGKEFLNWAQSNQMLQASINAQFDSMRKMQKEMRRLDRRIDY